MKLISEKSDLRSKWKVIKGTMGSYSVSSNGEVKSNSRVVNHGIGGGSRKINGRVLAQTIGNHGYPYVSLCLGGKPIKQLVHRLVLSEFVGDCPDGSEAMHLDGVRTNAILSNLRYGSPSCNQAFRFDDGTASIGAKHGLSKLSESDVLKICRMADSGATATKISMSFCVVRQTISKIINGHTWGWLTRRCVV